MKLRPLSIQSSTNEWSGWCGYEPGQGGFLLKDKYPNFEVGLKYIIMLFPYLLLCYIDEHVM